MAFRTPTSSSRRLTGKWCVAGGPNGVSCGNCQYSPNRIKDHKRHMQWVHFVRRHRLNWSPMSDHVVLCSIHFEDCNFTVKRDIAPTLGITLALKPDDIPSIDAANHREETDTLPARKKRTVRPLILISFSLSSGADFPCEHKEWF